MTADRSTPPAEGRCPACGREVLLIRRPVYEGFRKTGESLVCSACGHVFGADEQPEATGPVRPKVFADTDRSRDPDPFARDERGRLCRYCRHYTVNPFRQWCGLHRREVEATDQCPQFEARPLKALSPSDAGEKKPPPF